MKFRGTRPSTVAVAIWMFAPLACSSPSPDATSDGGTLQDASAPSEASPSTTEGGVGDSGFAPAVHAPFPQVPNNGGRILVSPQLVTVTFADYPYESSVQAFGDWIVASDWLTTVGKDYGVGAGQHVADVVLTSDLPAMMSSADVEPLLIDAMTSGALLSPPAPDSDFVYIVYFPSSTKTYSYSGAPYCTGWHSSFDVTVDGGSISVPYAAISTGCDYRPPGESELQDAEQEASHEIIEAATDPFPKAPAYTITDPSNPWHYLDGEVGDLCVFKTMVESGFEVQRIWSNSVAASGNADPCQPNPSGAPFYGTSTTSPSAIAIAAGQSAAITVTAWSSAPLGAWKVVPVPAYIFGRVRARRRVDVVSGGLQRPETSGHRDAKRRHDGGHAERPRRDSVGGVRGDCHVLLTERKRLEPGADPGSRPLRLARPLFPRLQVAFVEVEANAPAVDAYAQIAIPREVDDADDGRGEAPAAPTASAHLGPKASATQPTIGAPIGVPPSATARRIATTRPRIAGSVESWTVLFVVVVNVCAAMPMRTRVRLKRP